MTKSRAAALAPMIALAAGTLAATPALAHPHVWVVAAVTVRYDAGKITALEETWTFDEYYTAMAIEGLDKNNDGTYDRAELAELAQVNMDGLKEFSYFTDVKLGKSALKLADPTNYWLEHKGGILSLHFTLPLADPVLAEAKGFQFLVYDPSYFIAFEFAKENPVTIGAGAPPGCKADVAVPKQEAEEAQKLGEAFFSQLGGGDYGLGLAKTVTVTCGGK